MIATKSARIEFKTTADIKELLQKAANTIGMDLSSFLVSVATKQAREIIKEEKLLTLNSDEWYRLEEYLKNEKEPTKELKEIMHLRSFDG